MRIYVASSWKNLRHPLVVERLRKEGHEVYDYRKPAPGVDGFAWGEVDPDWESWSPAQYRSALQHDRAQEGYLHDLAALDFCDAVVLVLPSGRSAHLELGYALGMGVHGFILLDDPLSSPELMYKLATGICTTLDEVVTRVKAIQDTFAVPDVSLTVVPEKGPVIYDGEPFFGNKP